jgi:hypothetical protein
MPRRNAKDWEILKKDFFEQNISGRGCTLRQFAEQHAIKYTHLRNKSSTDNWSPELEEERESRAKLIAEQVQAAHSESLSIVQGEAINNEVTVRLRHARNARGIQAKAIERLRTVAVAELTVRESIELLRLGMLEERIALGLGQKNIAPLDDLAHEEPTLAVDAGRADMLLDEFLREVTGETSYSIDSDSDSAVH